MENFLNTLISTWPKKQSNATGKFEKNFLDSAAAEYVYQALNQNFSKTAIEKYISDFLDSVSQSQFNGIDLNQQKTDAASACFTLVTKFDEISIPERVVSNVISSFLPGYWFLFLEQLVIARMNKSLLATALLRAISNRQTSEDVILALDGVRLYSTAARSLENNAEGNTAVNALSNQIASLKLSQDIKIVNAAGNAENYIKSYM